MAVISPWPHYITRERNDLWRGKLFAVLVDARTNARREEAMAAGNTWDELKLG